MPNSWSSRTLSLLVVVVFRNAENMRPLSFQILFQLPSAVGKVHLHHGARSKNPGAIRFGDGLRTTLAKANFDLTGRRFRLSSRLKVPALGWQAIYKESPGFVVA